MRHKRRHIYICSQFYSWIRAWHKATIEFVKRNALISWFWTHLEVRALGKVLLKMLVFFSTNLEKKIYLVLQVSQSSREPKVVQRLDNAIHWVNRYPADKCWQNKPRYPLDNDLSGGYGYPHFEKPGPDVFTIFRPPYWCTMEVH